MAPAPGDALAGSFRDHQRLLWGLAYRMTGSAADADDVLQETFARALERPPARTDEPLRPWLVRVTLNAARDALRRRKKRSYVGPWLPSPVPDPADLSDDAPAMDARYELRESATFAFLLALEALTPQQRAVLLLRDVLDYSVRETAAALALGEANVKTTHHRARRAMESYDAERRPLPERAAATRVALERFLGALLMQDAAAVEACLAADARLVSDGGGEFHAALNVVRGRARVTRFFVGLQRKLGMAGQFEVRSLNGQPAIVARYDAPRPGWGPRFVLRCEPGPEGSIAAVHIVVASGKLTALGPAGG